MFNHHSIFKEIKEPNLLNRTREEMEKMVLICPVHKLLCTKCQFSTRIPLSWLSIELREELKKLN